MESGLSVDGIIIYFYNGYCLILFWGEGRGGGEGGWGRDNMKALRPSASHVRLIGCGPIIGRCD